MKTRAELQDALRALDEAEKAESKAKDKVRLNAWNAMVKHPDSSEWSVVERPWTPFMAPEGTAPIPSVLVQKRLKPERAAKFVEVFGPIVDEQLVQWRGMRYHRTSENILTHDSGGWCILNDPMLCSDQEWAQIVEGDIPAKYKK